MSIRVINTINPSIRFLTVLITAVWPYGCSHPGNSNKKNRQTQDKSPAPPVVYKKPASGFNDTLIVRGKAAVFYMADSVQLERIKAITEKMVYESNNHDCFYQMRNARFVLKKYWPGVPVIETSVARYLLFVNADKSSVCIDLNTKNDQCGIFLFEDDKAPKLADMTNIDTELGFYFPR